MKTLEQIIKDQIALLEERYERRLNYYSKTASALSAKEFWIIQANITKDQITLLEDILRIKELEN